MLEVNRHDFPLLVIPEFGRESNCGLVRKVSHIMSTSCLHIREPLTTCAIEGSIGRVIARTKGAAYTEVWVLGAVWINVTRSAPTYR